MSTTAPQPVSHPATMTMDVSGTAPVPFSRLTRAELRKSIDTRAGFWLLLITGIIVVAAMVIALVVTTLNDIGMDYGSFIATTTYTSSILLPVLGILLVTSEWTQRTAMVTFTLESNRMRVIAAKFAAGVLLTLAVAVLGIVVGAVANLIYAGIEGVSPSWDFGVLYLVGFLVTQTIAMATGFALAALLLNTPAAIVVYFAYSFVLPALIAIGSALIGWFSDLAPWIDFASAQAPLFDASLNTGEEWAHLLVSGFIWLVVPLAIGLRRVLRAEVK